MCDTCIFEFVVPLTPCLLESVKITWKLFFEKVKIENLDSVNRGENALSRPNVFLLIYMTQIG